MNFSVVIPTYNRHATLRQCLNALLAQSHPAQEIIVVDDGSTDGTAEMMTSDFPTIRYFRQHNAGPASARNRGIREATGDFIAFTDDDCLPPADWLERLADGYRRHPEVAGVGGYLDAPDEVLEHNALAQYDYFVSHTLYKAGDEEYVGGFECPAGGTNSMSYAKRWLDSVGGFDETFPYAAGEDADLKWRICQRGARLLYVPVRVLHLHRYEWESFRAQQIRRGRGAVHFERKHSHLPSPLRVALRAVKRGLYFWLDMARMPPAIAWVKLWAGWYECWGQWLEISRLSALSTQP